ncbi:MAG: hypothetical protein ABIV50_12345 [Opitutus sp.]
MSTRRNPGPTWSYELLRWMDRWLPVFVLTPTLVVGTGISLIVLGKQRRSSREYLAAVLGRRVRLTDVWRHFFTYLQMMLARIRAAEGGDHDCVGGSGFDAFRTLMTSDRPALLGTFHFGNSDLLGFLLGRVRRRVHMIRLRMDNSPDTHRLLARFGRWVSYVWVNEGENILFALKEAAQSGSSLAMMCDRVEHSSKVEAFHFLGARRLMPFTIYHLALLFRMPVTLCLSVPKGANASLVHFSSVFQPDDGSKESNLVRARSHFQAFLHQLETLLRANPYLWFNVMPAAATPDRVGTTREPSRFPSIVSSKAMSPSTALD